MRFSSEFKSWLQKKLSHSLPGEKAQYNLAPLKRKEEEMLARRHNKAPRPSSVLLLLYPHKGEVYVPLIVRNKYGGVHSGQVALPGGKYEKDDQDIMHTALRETAEEISVDVRSEQVIGKLSHLFVPVSNYIIHPYIAWLDERPKMKADQTEVSGVLEVPLAYLADPQNITSKKIKTANGYVINAPGIPVENEFLWGATAMLMSEFISIVREYNH